MEKKKRIWTTSKTSLVENTSRILLYPFSDYSIISFEVKLQYFPKSFSKIWKKLT